MLVRVFEQPNGRLSILKLNFRLRNEGESDQAFLERIAVATIRGDPSLAGLPFVDLDESGLPPDRNQRNNWRLEGKKIVVLAKE